MINESWLKDVGNAVIEDYEKHNGNHGTNYIILFVYRVGPLQLQSTVKVML